MLGMKSDEVRYLREKGLGDVANTVDYKPFEYSNPLVNPDSRGSMSLNTPGLAVVT